VTALQHLYAKERLESGRGHHAALRAISAATGLDKDTIQRCLRRAERADERDAKGRASA
jgi:hypothetical protein